MSSILFFNDKSTLVVNELFDLLKNEFNNKQMVQVTLGNRKMVVNRDTVVKIEEYKSEPNQI